ncbi:hypothetical protein [Streptomyces capitiformicae]|nr:hypothetical protein [Streptomyces capitiformicae]
MAKTGYGKRSVGDEDPHADPDFAHLSPRDAEIAVFIDHIEDGRANATGCKALAAEQPHFVQQAARSSRERRTGGPVPDTFRPVPIDDLVMYHFRDNRDRIANGLAPRRWNW